MEPIAAAQGRRRRLSLLHYLTALALAPVIGLCVLTVLLVAGERQQAAAATRVQRAITRIDQLSHLHQAVAREITASTVAVSGPALGLSAAQLRELLGSLQQQSPSLQQLRTETDTRIQQLNDGEPGSATLIADLRQHLAVGRQSLAVNGSADRRQQVRMAAATLEEWKPFVTRLLEAQQQTNRALAVGAFGPVTSAALTAGRDLAILSALAGQVQAQSFALFTLIGAEGPERTAVLTALARSRQEYAVLADAAPTELSDRSAQAWSQFSAGAGSAAAAAITTTLQTPAQPATGQVGERDAVAAVITVGAAHRALMGMLEQSAADGAQAAAQAADQASRRAVAALGAATVLLLVTASSVIVLGGVIRRRLGDLADAARRLSAGQLQTVPVQGPREVEALAQGLNDAAVTLQQVVHLAEQLAQGDVESVRQAQPVGGRLGLAVQASVDRVAEAIRSQEALRRELTYQAEHDPLTGLLNRASASTVLAGALRSSHLAGHTVAVLYVDLDFFKQINDSHGHHAGDHVLQISAARMLAAVRRHDAVCRIGGDEFVIILPDQEEGSDAATEIGQRLVQKLAEPIPYQGHDLQVGASIGLARSSGCDDADALLADADHAVYRAKSQGRSTLSV